MFEIKIGKMPGEIRTFTIEEDTKVEDALALAGLSAEGYEIRVDTEVVTAEYALDSYDKMLVLVKKIKGN